MALSAFHDRESQPTSSDVASVLGRSAPLWQAFVHHVNGLAPGAFEEWNFPGAKYGWSMRLVAGKRRLIYLTPQAGEFLVGVVLGEKAIARATQTGLSPEVAELLDAAPKYPEGRGVRLTVRTKRDLRLATQLFAVKLA